MAYQFEYGFGLPRGEYRRIEISDAAKGRSLQAQYRAALQELDLARTAPAEKLAKAKIRRIIAAARKA